MLQRRLRALERAVFQQASVAGEKAKVTIFLPHNGREPLSEQQRSGETGIVIYEAQSTEQARERAKLGQATQSHRRTCTD
jgi:hypothetical protein